MLDKVDLFLAPSHFLRETFLRVGLPAEKIRYSDNGMNLKLFAGFQRTPSDRLRFGFTGILIPSKGVHVLVEAFNGIDPAQASLHIWGMDLPYDGYEHYGQELRQRATNPSIHFMGPYANTDVARVLAEIDVLVVPSIWYENSPLTIHEAFLSRTPVIATDLGGMAEYVQHSVNGLLFAPRGVADLRAKMQQVLDDPLLLDRLRQGIGTFKSIEENAAELEEIYIRLVRSRQDGDETTISYNI
jgi:glycosyltransferase involved in cell wall biosynthesis